MLKTFPAKVRKDGSLTFRVRTARERLGLKPGDTVQVRSS